MKKRIGILTFHHVHNFGAVWQAWSLCAAIRALGHDARVIDYRPPIGHQAPRRGWRRLLPSPGRIRSQRFVRRHIPLTPRPLARAEEVDALVDSGAFDVLVCGSDQVWRIFEHQGMDRPYFLDVGTRPGVRRISYAPSAGDLASFGPFTEAVAASLARFDALSVRDANTATALAGAGFPEATRVLDPTLIADLSPHLSARPAAAGGEEIVVVGRMDAAADRYIRFAAGKLGARVRAVGTRSGAADVQRPYASPVEWLNAIAGARLVITSLFHGAALALALRRPFVALDCGGRAFKLADLCGHLGVPERLLERGEAADYARDADLLAAPGPALESRLAEEAARSRAWLKEALDG